MSLHTNWLPVRSAFCTMRELFYAWLSSRRLLLRPAMRLLRLWRLLPLTTGLFFSTTIAQLSSAALCLQVH